ncbi:MAG: SMC family ATPase [Nitrososphaeraceae archaeon]|nr:SMC family ATPase [Nitrososphaeraceae archaeon]
MKILKIEAKNFKPFNNISVPANGYFDDGFFFIKGKNSMGKTSFIEVILWGILGEQLMIEKDRKLLIKNGESKCEVAVTFEISNIQYRVIRSIESIKKKITKINEHRFDNNNLFKSSAILFKKDNIEDENKSKFIQICRGTTAVNKEIESYLGIYPESIEKTVYIRQKEVDKLALADPIELRELIKSLFGLEEFDDNIKVFLRNKTNKLNQEIKELNLQLGSLITEKTEQEKQNRLLEDKEKKLYIEQEELLNDRVLLNTYPDKDILMNIKNNIEVINKSNNDLSYIKRLINREKENLTIQKNRIKEFQDKISNANHNIKKISEEIEKYPKIDTLKPVKDILQEIENDEKHAKKLIIESELDLPFNFQNISIDSFNGIQLEISKHKQDVENIETKKYKKFNLLEEQKKLLNSNQILSKIKKNSIEYIDKSNICPICSNIIINSSTLITSIEQEIYDFSRKEKIIKENIEKIEIELQKIELDLDDRKKKKQTLELIKPFISRILEKRFSLFDEINFITKLEQNDYVVSGLTSKTIDELILKIIKKENEGFTLTELIKNFEDKLKSENLKLEKIISEIDKLYEQYNKTKVHTDSCKNSLTKICKNLKRKSLEDLFRHFSCQNVDEMISKRMDLFIHIKEKSKLVEVIKYDISSLKEDINSRLKRIHMLQDAQKELKEKEKYLKHILFLIGEIDGFISNDIVEGKLANVLMHSTNYYLIPFTEGRYKISNVSSTMRKTKDRISHGLALTLIDNKDKVQKNKEQLSGGDESALGLALRIAISNLMSTIRPFKYVEKKIPMINFIILDEPLTSLDEFRRNIIMNILINDKSFKQIFLISHADIYGYNYNSIIINDEENSERKIQYIQQ